MSRPDWQQRVVDERDQLDERLERLARFIASPKFYELDLYGQHLMHAQHHAMTLYQAALDHRIARF
ncbi:crAss001_48 related protein [Burkholderia ubonensis]|uniref:crAss001_48 related protein n=1 Tax=Burkholderia ubonensis TaxID=101571 RepID=UPI001160E065|nr:hypothetical protein [Burkholderia ubonensis]